MNQAVSKFSSPAPNSTIKLCECGCGRPAPIAKKTLAKLGHIKGRPVRFISGHAGRRWLNSFVHRDDGTTVITLTCGTRSSECLVDTADFPIVKAHRWCPQRRKGTRTTYASAYVRKPDGRETRVAMHRLLLPGVPEVDHEDRNGLNNRRSNLRPATRSQNAMNRGKTLNTSSRFIGVCWNGSKRKWGAQIQVGRKIHHLGFFDSQEAAAKTRDAKAKELHGPFANLNFPEVPRVG